MYIESANYRIQKRTEDTRNEARTEKVVRRDGKCMMERRIWRKSDKEEKD